MRKMDYNNLIRSAIKAKELAYVPYSGFRVGAALLAADGRIFTGCNIENAAYSPTICAERTAVAKAVSEGCRDFTAIVVTGDAGDYLTPCGVCRQVMREFCSDDFTIYLVGANGTYKKLTLAELLPYSFSASEHMT